MSEHFLNVDQLLSKSPPAQDKKKVKSEQNTTIVAEQQVASAKAGAESAQVGGLESVRSNWEKTLAVIRERLGSGTAGLLTCAQPVRFENGTLTLEFGASAAVQKKMCEGNGRIEQIAEVCSEQLGTDVRVELQIAEGETQTAEEPAQPRTRSQRQIEMINDPAVKTVLMGLDATIAGIEES